MQQFRLPLTNFGRESRLEFQTNDESVSTPTSAVTKYTHAFWQPSHITSSNNGPSLSAAVSSMRDMWH